MAQPYRLDSADVRALLRVSGQVVADRDDPRKWRHFLRGSLRDLLRADAGLALEIEPDGQPSSGRVVAFFDHGLAGRDRRNAILRELNEPEITDPLLLALLKRLYGSRYDTVTFARSDVIRDDHWKKSPLVARRRAAAGFDDSVASLTRIKSPQRVMGLVFLRSTGGHPFDQRERTLLELATQSYRGFTMPNSRAVPRTPRRYRPACRKRSPTLPPAATSSRPPAP